MRKPLSISKTVTRSMAVTLRDQKNVRGSKIVNFDEWCSLDTTGMVMLLRIQEDEDYWSAHLNRQEVEDLIAHLNHALGELK